MDRLPELDRHVAAISNACWFLRAGRFRPAKRAAAVPVCLAISAALEALPREQWLEVVEAVGRGLMPPA